MPLQPIMFKADHSEDHGSINIEVEHWEHLWRGRISISVHESTVPLVKAKLRQMLQTALSLLEDD